MAAQQERMKKSWLAPAMSTQSQVSETDVMLQTFMTGGGGNRPAEISMESIREGVDHSMEQYSAFPQQPLHGNNTSLATDLSQEDDQDWSIPVSKFLQGFRVQAGASLSNAYRYVVSWYIGLVLLDGVPTEVLLVCFC